MKTIPRMRIITPFVLLIVVFLVLNLTGFSGGMKNFFYLISSPIQKNLWQVGDSISDFFAGVFRAEDLKKEKDELFVKNQELTSQIATLKELEKENETLREALDLGLEKEFQLVISEIINKDISQDSLLINLGSRDGISQGLPVITSQKVLVGQIGQVYKDFSEVTLITNKESSFDAKISEREVYGVIRGKGNSEVYFDLISKEEEISQGETVVTTALGGIFPSKILVGSIREIKKSDVELFQTAELVPSFELQELYYLFIITDF